VPVALICTDQFAKLKAGVEKRTGWTGEQFEHRVKRYKKLPGAPTKGDLEAVARKLLAMRWNSDEQEWSVAGSKPHPDFVKMVVGYALTCKMRLPAVADTITEARHQARERDRFSVAATDLRNALLNYQIPSDEALQGAFEMPTSRPTSSNIARNPQFALAANLQSRCNRIATALQ
jgi:hypothetical protein